MKVESPLIKFSQAVKYLIKNGTLDGDFVVQVRVYQVEFEDGSSWKDDWGDISELLAHRRHSVILGTNEP